MGETIRVKFETFMLIQ